MRRGLEHGRWHDNRELPTGGQHTHPNFSLLKRATAHGASTPVCDPNPSRSSTTPPSMCWLHDQAPRAMRRAQRGGIDESRPNRPRTGGHPSFAPEAKSDAPLSPFDLP
jgi:hypothetical protein